MDVERVEIVSESVSFALGNQFLLCIYQTTGKTTSFIGFVNNNGNSYFLKISRVLGQIDRLNKCVESWNGMKYYGIE